MPPTPGLNILNDGPGTGIVGATTDPHDFGVSGVNKTAGPSPQVAGPGGVCGTATRPGGLGVYGVSVNGVGVQGYGRYRGVVGVSDSYGLGSTPPVADGYGVIGMSRVGVFGYGTVGPAQNGLPGKLGIIGVQGMSDLDRGVGVEGDSDSATGIGTLGSSESGSGVVGVTRTGIGVRASVDPSDPDQAGWALLTNGDAIFQGALYVAPGFSKSALIKARDGSHRALYCVESPECWFEDFGRARLVHGRARVRVDPTFAAVVRTGDYHVFLSPEGVSHGLYVSRRTRDGFEVREQHRGTSTVAFSYRIVARRKDVDAPRFKRVKLPNLAKLAQPSIRKAARTARPPKTPAGVRRADLERLLRFAKGSKPPMEGPSRRRGRRR